MTPNLPPSQAAYSSAISSDRSPEKLADLAGPDGQVPASREVPSWRPSRCFNVKSRHARRVFPDVPTIRARDSLTTAIRRIGGSRGATPVKVVRKLTIREYGTVVAKQRFLGCLGVGTLVALVSVVPLAAATGAAPSGWNIVVSPNTDPSQSNLFMDATCSNAWSCWAVGGVIPSLGGNSQPDALIDSWNGSAWSVESDPVPPEPTPPCSGAWTCVVASDCWAVGGQEPNGSQGPQTLAEHWDGSTWSVVPTPAVDGYLFSVTCSASADCWAVGDSNDGQGNPLNGIIYHWNGSAWSQIAAPPSGQTYDQLESVTCTNSSDCWAVGSAGPNQIQYNFLPGIAPTVVGANALIEHWDGSTWSVVTNNNSPGSDQYLTAVTCTESTNCWTVGSTMDSNGNPSSSLVEHWDGSTWTPTPSLDPTTPANILTSVTCITSSQCWAAGATNSASGQTRRRRRTSKVGMAPAGRSSPARTSWPLATSAE